VTVSFIHLSDIHFGQERDDALHFNNDVKAQLIVDAAEVVRALPGGVAHGILVTGDIAQAGKADQYTDAGRWLDQLADAVGCESFRIQMVPGNHDLDRNLLSKGGKLMLDAIRDGGAAEYEAILASSTDRAVLFARFREYGKFCEGYDCALDPEGRYATNMLVELAPGRFIRFVRLNSSLLCTGDEDDKNPELMVGARQFTIPRTKGEEIVALIHHPLNWFKDSVDVAKYLKSRARILISGHEHNPRVHIEQIEKETDFMMLAAGATVPTRSNEPYAYTYNVIEFDWDSGKDALAVKIHPRAWNPDFTRFEADSNALGKPEPDFVLGCPNFRASAATVPQNQVSAAVAHETPTVEIVAELVENAKEPEVKPELPGYRLLLLRFFRDLTEGERLRVLTELDAIPLDSEDLLTQATERHLFDWLIGQGKLENIQHLVDHYMQIKDGGEEK
jgi:predicted phosphodiesterase